MADLRAMKHLRILFAYLTQHYMVSIRLVGGALLLWKVSEETGVYTAICGLLVLLGYEVVELRFAIQQQRNEIFRQTFVELLTQTEEES